MSSRHFVDSLKSNEVSDLNYSPNHLPEFNPINPKTYDKKQQLDYAKYKYLRNYIEQLCRERLALC